MIWRRAHAEPDDALVVDGRGQPAEHSRASVSDTCHGHSDIPTFRHWHKRATCEPGFDVVIVYPTHGHLFSSFLNPRMSTRSDESGGRLESRMRLVRDLLEEAKDAIGDRCAVAVRFSADERISEDGEPTYVT